MNRHCRLGALSHSDSNEQNIAAPFQSCIVTGTGIMSLLRSGHSASECWKSPDQRLRRREFKKSEKHTTKGTTQSSSGQARLSKKRSAA
jgi:hypothetical protein